jgi:hypothetical protein
VFANNIQRDPGLAFTAALWLVVLLVMARFVHRECAASPLPRTMEMRGPVSDTVQTLAVSTSMLRRICGL